MPQDQDDIKGADAMKQAPTPGPLSGDDWTPWSGGPRPHPPATRVRVRYRDGSEDEGASAFADWFHSPRRSDPKDIIAFRLVAIEASGSERDSRLNRVISMLERVIGPTASVRVYEHEAKAILAALRPQPSGETREAEFTSVSGLWKDQSLSRLERVRAFRLEFGGELKPALEAVDEESARQSLIRPAPVASGGQHSSGEGERADKLASVLTELMPAVRAYLMTGDVMSQSIKKKTWKPVLKRAQAALTEAAKVQTTDAAGLIETIRTRLLGVAPDDQDVTLEDSDWLLILGALEGGK